MSAKTRILCVDDEPNVLRMMERMLSRAGYEVLTAPGGEQGLKLLSDNHVDVIISDQRMPGMSGSEFLREAKSVIPRCARIMMSGYSDFENLVSAVNEGEIFRFLPKPCETDKILDVVQTAVAQQDIIRSIETLIGTICTASSLEHSISTVVEDGGRVLSVDIKEGAGSGTRETLAGFLQDLLERLGQNADAECVTQHVSKEDGRIVIHLDIGKGLNLRIRLM